MVVWQRCAYGQMEIRPEENVSAAADVEPRAVRQREKGLRDLPSRNASRRDTLSVVRARDDRPLVAKSPGRDASFSLVTKLTASAVGDRGTLGLPEPDQKASA